MKVTAQEEYGLRCILQLARHHGGEPLLSRTIAEREGISIDYVRKLLMCLRRGELVESVRGLRGGYVLTQSPAIDRLLEVPWFASRCLLDGQLQAGERCS